MSGPLAWSLGGLLVLLAAACLLDRRLCRACLTFVAFALVMAFAWWQLGAPWLAVAEALLGALFTGATLLHAFGRAGDVPRLPPRDETPPASGSAALRLAVVLAWLALAALAASWLLGGRGLVPPRVALASPLPGGLVVMALGLWAFARHRHLLRQLLAFNVLGSGVFLLLAGLGGTAPEVQGLILVGLVVALVGSVLGALLLRRLHALAGQVSLEPEGGP